MVRQDMGEASWDPSRLIGNGEAYQDIVARLCRALLRPGDLALDGGAGQGRYAFAMAGLVGESGRVIACEPIPGLAERLRIERRRRGMPHMAVHRVALAEQAGEADFLWVCNAEGYSALRPRPYPMTPEIAEIPVTLATIDDLLAGATRPWRLGVLDLQGGEVPALRGAARAVAAHRPVLVFHHSREIAARAHDYDAAAFFALFEQLGYQLTDILGRAFGPADWDDPSVPWFAVAAPAGSEAQAALPDLLRRLAAEVAGCHGQAATGDLEGWLARQEQAESPARDRVLALETWQRVAGPLLRAREVAELGEPSPIGRYLEEERGAALRWLPLDHRHPLPPLDASVDAVLALEVLQRLPDHAVPGAAAAAAGDRPAGARHLFAEAQRVLRPGGCLVVTTPNPTSLQAIGRLLRRRQVFGDPETVREYSPREVLGLAESAGFATEAAGLFEAREPEPDIHPGALAAGLRAMGYDMRDREEHAWFLFRKA
ncbi:class I SAM-dependent methyltransferase [Paracraurococcus lichenis]|uniref:Class I SAM-dependent methyltransferase n=1 Tax=Paracraurococcus lichenis TaxID=3064888 RepID=A0ABT9DXJ3_9PROT|nr:class I SAM-dependent methyltransferase [Paracraurococcus sp. LOR1-02]MDO9708625.1 class I SAM-dependent methyltransferase [Paracraurococcus sp. LOR1-02]